MLNHIAVMGRLTRDPELRQTKSNIPVVRFTVAVDRDFTSGKDKVTDFIPVVCFNKTAEFVSKYFHKGSAAIVIGSLHIRNYEDRDGNKRTAAEVAAQSVDFGEYKRSETAPSAEQHDDSRLNQFMEENKEIVQDADKNGGFTEDREFDDSDGELPF